LGSSAEKGERKSRRGTLGEELYRAAIAPSFLSRRFKFGATFLEIKSLEKANLELSTRCSSFPKKVAQNFS